MICKRCGLGIVGKPHETADDCLEHLAPRYAMAQRSAERLHEKLRRAEEKIERYRVQARLGSQAIKRELSLAGRIARIEKAMGWSAR